MRASTVLLRKPFRIDELDKAVQWRLIERQ
jgi:hypothetical protein